MKHKKIDINLFFMLIFVAAATAVGDPSVVKIEKTGNQFTLIRNGEPYFIKGAGGGAHMDALVAAGGNSIRTWNRSKETLDRAQEKGLTVCMGLRMEKPRHGADYTNEEMLKKQQDQICKQVDELKDHPALLLWGIGNEVEHQAGPEDCKLVWQEIEKIAQKIKSIDSNHPVITVIAGAGPKLQDIKRLCPTLDAIGINSYRTLPQVPEQIEKFGWDKPYVITEFGPRGWWEAEKTEWGLPIEDTSTEKSQFYYEVYKAGIDQQPNCLGSYVFLWGNKQEKTHTWFCLFLPDGTPTEMIDTMTLLWTGNWPVNRAPKIGSKEIFATDGKAPNIYKPADKIQFKVDAEDPDGDPIAVKWDLRRDESDNPATGGDWEQRVPPIEDTILSSEADRAVIQMPQEPGNYRIFVYAADPSGKSATANLPIKVE